MHEREFDVVVVGSGGAGLTAAIVAADQGARVLVAECSDKFGGTTAFSGGKLWIPDNAHLRRLGIPDSREKARGYLRRAIGDDYPEMIDTFLERGPEVIDYLEAETPLKFYSCRQYPDYHPEWDGALPGGRALDAVPYDATGLADLLPFLRRSPTFLPFTHEEWETWRSVTRFDWELIAARIQRNIFTAGAAIVGALIQGCLDRGITLWRNARAVRLLGNGRIEGVELDCDQQRRSITTRRGVVLACGGFEWSPALRRAFLRAPIFGAASPPANQGDGVIMAAEIGAQLGNTSEAWWMPLMRVPGEEVDGQPLYRAMITERGLPGSIIVNRHGHRFVNEAMNYNDLSKAFQEFDSIAYEWANVPAWLIFDNRFRNRYSLATIMPGEPVPDWVARADSLPALAGEIGVDPRGLVATVERFNEFTQTGSDLDFGRGESIYDRYYGDSSVEPNPNLAAIGEPPFYALDVIPGTIGTKGGVMTDTRARVLDVRGRVMPGLYACGNVASFWTGRGYPGPGASLGFGMTFGYLAGLECGPGPACGDA